MKMYYIDDKASELLAAKKAILSAGHDLPFLSDYFGEAFIPEATPDERLGGVLQIVKEAKDEGAGIITDLMFQTSPHFADEIPPAGLLVVIHCLALGVPVVICTNAAEVGGHHGKALAWIHDAYVQPARDEGTLPFGWVEDKDWDKAVALLAQMMSGDPGE